MKADRRNTTVVIALILSMTIGMRVLLWLAPPSQPTGYAAPTLAALGGEPVRAVFIQYATTWTDVDTDDALRAGVDSVSIVTGDHEPAWLTSPRGPRVLLAVLGDAADTGQTLSPQQQRWVLAALSELKNAGGARPVRFSLQADSDPLQVLNLPQAAKDLRELLVRKQIIDDGQGA